MKAVIVNAKHETWHNLLLDMYITASLEHFDVAKLETVAKKILLFG
mgnify:CR=1 FL=1